MKIIIFLSLYITQILTQETLKDIREHADTVCSEPDHKHFNKHTLTYITPW
jgi:hypothetical protein